MAAQPSVPGLLSLPPEIRQGIFVAFFRSVIIRSRGPWRRLGESEKKPALDAVLVCRQFYREAEPLLPNVQVYFFSDATVVKALMKLGPERIMQLRHLRVSHIPVGFKSHLGASRMATATKSLVLMGNISTIGITVILLASGTSTLVLSSARSRACNLACSRSFTGQVAACGRENTPPPVSGRCLRPTGTGGSGCTQRLATVRRDA